MDRFIAEADTGVSAENSSLKSNMDRFIDFLFNILYHNSVV